MKKIAIKVNNKREFDALMKHYESKGWDWYSGVGARHYQYVMHCVEYNDGFNWWSDAWICLHETIILDFPTFSQLTGVEVTDEIIVQLPSTYCIVTEYGVFFPNAVYQLGNRHLEEIYTAYKSLTC